MSTFKLVAKLDSVTCFYFKQWQDVLKQSIVTCARCSNSQLNSVEPRSVYLRIGPLSCSTFALFVDLLILISVPKRFLILRHCVLRCSYVMVEAELACKISFQLICKILRSTYLENGDTPCLICVNSWGLETGRSIQVQIIAIEYEIWAIIASIPMSDSPWIERSYCNHPSPQYTITLNLKRFMTQR